MNPRLRLALFLALGALLGIFIGVEIADEHYAWATVTAVVCFWIFAEWASAAPPDAWLLAGAVVGYVVGNRGFAQTQPAGNLPLLPAEAVLLVSVPAFVVRVAMKRVVGVRKDFLNYAILVWMLVGTARLPVDLARYGVMALRDYAMIYYASFFFISQAFGSSAASVGVLKRALTLSFVALLPAVIIVNVSPDFLYNHFTWNGIPLIYHKSDLIATSLAAGFFWLWTRGNESGHRFWFLLAGTSLLLIGLMASPRAAMAAVAVTTALWLLFRRWRIAAAQVGIVAAASILTLAVLGILGRDIRTSAPYSAYEHAVSIFDPAGTGTYINGESGDPGDNNRFRIIWWGDVIHETLETNPVLGMGFGSDLAIRFLADYDLLSDENFSARSPHSIVMTVFGRMGIAGLLAWIVVSAGLARMAWRLIKRGDPDGLGLTSIVCVTWISACVGVVLEGPMGAVVFWTVAGLANSCALGVGVPADGAAAPADESSVAKSVLLHTHSSPR